MKLQFRKLLDLKEFLRRLLLKFSAFVGAFCPYCVLLILSVARADEGFYLKEQLPKNKQFVGFEEAMQAAFSLYNQPLDRSCSGAFISRDGYALTALHCVASCLTNVSSQTLVTEISSEALGYRIFKTTKSAFSDLRCPGFSVENSPLKNPRLLFVGKGIAEFDDLKIARIPKHLRTEIFNSREDFAVLKFDVVKPTSCLSVAAQPDFRAGVEVWALGVPASTQRKRTPHSDGESLFISFGKITANVTQSSYLRVKRAPPVVMKLLLETHPQKDFFNDMDLTEGNSGGVVVNKSGEIVGLHHSVMSEDSATQYYSGSSIALKITEVQKAITSALGDSAFKTFFNCPK